MKTPKIVQSEAGAKSRGTSGLSDSTGIIFDSNADRRRRVWELTGCYDILLSPRIPHWGVVHAAALGLHVNDTKKTTMH